ncbi:MAG: glycosyltransferase [Rhodospirillales bacterium]|nr:glycosyltransferase [Rhodospirillales bacterium]
MIVSIVIPAYKASATLGETLASVFAPSLLKGWQLEVIVANDGSPDHAAQKSVVDGFAGVHYLSHEPNQGKCAAMNLGIANSHGEIIILLDADDTLVTDWQSRLARILKTWPIDAPLCFSACETQTGDSTVADPDYTGRLSFDDMLNERHMGEYLPIFRGDALRVSQGYRDPGEPYGCELWTYLSFAEHADLWVSAEVLRIYHTDRPGSMTSSMCSPQTANRVVRCYDFVFKDFEPAYRTYAPQNLGRRRLRQAVFAAIAGQRARAWSLWKIGARWTAPLETIAALLMITLGPGAINVLVGTAKKARILRRYG